MTTLIREAAEEDFPRLADLFFQLSVLGEIPVSEQHQFGGGERDALEVIQRTPHATCFVLDVDGNVQGTVTFYLLPNLSHGGRPFAIVESVVVDEAARGSGYGRLLMDHAETRARQAGCYKIALASNRKRDEAHVFYARLGYKPTHQGFTKYFDLL
jgi:GNAT superfamily N-acetyltransferase